MTSRLTLAERVEHFKTTFPTNQAAWPWLVKERGHAVLYARWLGGGDYRAKTGFYGEFPRGFLAKLLALFPDIDAAHVLHAFSGSLQKGAYTRLDCNADLAPDVVGNVYDAAALLGGRRFRLVIADPPYTTQDAKNYDTAGVNRGRATRALFEVTAPRGFLAWLDCCWPMHTKTQWRTVGRIAITRSTNHRLRDLTIFERVGLASGCATGTETAKPEVGLVPESADPPSALEQAETSVCAPVVSLQAERCARGVHARLIDSDPIDHGACVNVPHVCVDCGTKVSESSWTREAWDAHQAKLARRSA